MFEGRSEDFGHPNRSYPNPGLLRVGANFKILPPPFPPKVQTPLDYSLALPLRNFPVSTEQRYGLFGRPAGSCWGAA